MQFFMFPFFAWSQGSPEINLVHISVQIELPILNPFES